jgi:putative ABC transport system substrate-binding protein
MKRRDFITAVGAAAAVWPFAARAQSPAKPPTIGYLFSGKRWTAAFVRRLQELGWTEGSTLKIEYRGVEGAERLDEIAAELVRLKVNVIVTVGTPLTMAAKRATSVVPIVFAVTGDPVGIGLVASLARPGGNLTGLSNQTTDAASKRVELLREIVPNLRRLAILSDGINPAIMREADQAEAAARALGLEVVPLDVRRADDIAPAFAELNGRADALYLTSPLFFNNNRGAISG